METRANARLHRLPNQSRREMIKNELPNTLSSTACKALAFTSESIPEDTRTIELDALNKHLKTPRDITERGAGK